MYLFQKASLKVSDVVIVLKEKHFSEYNIEEEINGIKGGKKNNLKLEDYNYNSNDVNQKINKGLNYLFYELYNNMSIDIENVEIILESSEKTTNVIGLFVKKISSVKTHNCTNKIIKDFSFVDAIFYMNDEKAKYAINKIIKKEEKKKKNKRNINEEDIYNKIKYICNNLHKKKYIISEIPSIVLSTSMYVSNSTDYYYHNSKFLFKKNSYFNITCTHCDKYLFQCKEVKKDKSIFQNIFIKKEKIQQRNKQLYSEINCKCMKNNKNIFQKDRSINTTSIFGNVEKSCDVKLKKSQLYIFINNSLFICCI